MSDTTNKQDGRIANGGMGGFLNPPTHPTHTLHVETDVRRRKENRGSLSLDYALKAEYLDDAVRAKVRFILNAWKPLPLEHEDTQDWIHQCLGYFKTCYRNPKFPEPQCWHADKMLMTSKPEEHGLHNVNDHAAVHLIRKFYPDFVPTLANMLNAYWGTKPTVLCE